MKNPSHIARIEQTGNRNFCWKLAVQRNREQIVEYFSDGRYGGKRGSLKAAMKRRKELLAQAPPPLPIKNRKTVRNKTGKVGVRLCDGVDRRLAIVHRYLSYVAFWTGTDGRACTIGFSFNKYGKKKAFELAGIARDNESRDRDWIEEEFRRKKRDKIRRG